MRTHEQVETLQREIESTWTHTLPKHQAVYEAARLLGYSDIQAGYLALWLNYYDGWDVLEIHSEALQVIWEYECETNSRVSEKGREHHD